MHTFWVIVTTQPGASFFWRFGDGLGFGGTISRDGVGGTTSMGQCLSYEEELEELEHEELESDEEQSDEWEEEEHQSLTESATDSSFIIGTTYPVPPRMLLLSPGTISGPHN